MIIQTKDTSISGKYIMSHTSPDYFTGKKNDKKLQIMMTNTRSKHQKLKKVMKVLIILKHQIIFAMIVLSRQPKKENH